MPTQSAAWRHRNLGRLLFSATDLFVRDKLRIVNAGGFGAVTEVQMALVQNLDLHGTRLTTIAARANMTKQSMLELVDKAEAQGLIERRSDPDDQRAKMVTFTPSGLDMLDRVREGVAAAEQRMEAVMGAAFVSDMKERLNLYIAAEEGGDADALKMSDRNAAWRRLSVNRVMVSASGAFVRDVLRVVHGGGFDAVAPVHLTVLRNLDLRGTRLTEIASRARMTKQAMAELIDKTEALAFVARRPDPDDGRAKVIVFTPAGHRLLEQVRRGVDSAEGRMAAVTGDDFIGLLRRRLTDYVASADTGHPAYLGFGRAPKRDPA